MAEPSRPSVTSQVFAALVSLLEAAGISQSAFAQATQLDLDALRASRERISLDEVMNSCERAVALSGDPALGLHLAERISERAFGPVSTMLMHARSLRQGLELIKHFEPLFIDQPSFEVVEADDAVAIRLSSRAFSARMTTRFVPEMMLAGMLRMTRACFTPEATPRSVRFTYPAPHYRSEYVRVFGELVSFEQEASEISFARALVDAPSPYSDPELHAALRSVADGRLSRGG